MSKRLKVIIIASIGLALFGFLGIRTLSNNNKEIHYSSEWIKVKEIKAPLAMRIAAFMNEDFGVIGGPTGRGKTRLTTDGGTTWELSEESGGCIYGMQILDEDTIWIAGRKTGVSFTTPGGIRLKNGWEGMWENPTDFTFLPDRTPISFIDRERGWSTVAATKELYQTTDGGVTIETLGIPEDVGQFGSVQMINEDEGYIFDDKMILYYTDDAGENWTSNRLELGDMNIVKVSAVSSAIRFTDQKNGQIIAALKNDDGPKIYILTTDNGGRSWNIEILCDGAGSVFISADGQYITINNESDKLIRLFKNELING